VSNQLGDLKEEKSYSFIKKLMIVAIAIFAPKFFIRYENSELIKKTSASVLFGLSSLVRDKASMNLVKSAKIGVICDLSEPTGQTLPEVLLNERYFLQHLFLTDATEGELGWWRQKFSNVHKIGGDDFAKFKKQCSDISLLVFDIQSLGIRSDSASNLLKNVMDVSSDLKINLMILDAPNPLGGKVEGPGNVPFRHGITIGELANYWNELEFGGKVALKVVPVRGWRRGEVVPEFCRGGKEIGLSASIMSFMAPFFHVKPFSSFLQTNELDPGSLAIMMPGSNKLSNWELLYLKDMLVANGVQSLSHFKKNDAGQKEVLGLKICEVEQRENGDSFSAFLKTMRFFSNRKTISVDYDNCFDQAVGAKSVRETLQGKKTFKELKEEIKESQVAFLRNIEPYLLYSPAPYQVPMGKVRVSRI
jgi:uncharacterized protein YbbC (DUF1343 family)